ncbi:hypothetical protein RclHR1_20920003 [Rhizophagus clarus]|nr:hypothetical protein RclHR1_20920003 [Rhizophagus clarus]
MNLYELVDHLQQFIIDLNSLNNDWIIRNGIKLFNTISRHKGVFPKLEEFSNNIMSREPKLLIGSSEFWGLDNDALLSIIQLDNLNMKEIDIWENLIKWGIAKNSSLNSDMTTWSIDEFETLKETISSFIQHIRFFQMTPQEYFYKIRPLGKLLPKELEEDLNVYYIVPDCKLVTKVLPPRKSYSSILLVNHFNLISYWIDGGKEVMPNGLKNGQYKYSLLLRGSRDGFGIEDFKLKCNNKGATVVLIKLKNSNKIIGGYNPIKWSGSNKFLNSNSSFIFSFYSNTLNSFTIVLSRVAISNYAIADGADKNQGFGESDLFIFKRSCKLAHYSAKIHDSENFEIDDYEVYKVIEK